MGLTLTIVFAIASHVLCDLATQLYPHPLIAIDIYIYIYIYTWLQRRLPQCPMYGVATKTDYATQGTALERIDPAHCGFK